MAVDPQVGVPVTFALAVIAILGQVVTYFTKQSREPENGTRNQVRVNTENIEKLQDEIRECARVDAVRSLERDLRDGSRRLGTAEEQIKSNMLEILNIRPRLHQMANDISRLNFAEEERNRKRKP